MKKQSSKTIRSANYEFMAGSVGSESRRKCVESRSSGLDSLSDCYIEISGRSSTKQLQGVTLVEADNGRLQVRGLNFLLT
jgi:hypothetical protein